MDSISSALKNLESRLSLALNAATQAEHDLNSVRLQAGLPPYKFFHLSAAVVAESRTGPRGAVKLSDQDQDETANMIVDAGRVARGQAVDMTAARKLRLVERDRNR
jgi:hypothetical protein